MVPSKQALGTNARLCRLGPGFGPCVQSCEPSRGIAPWRTQSCSRTRLLHQPPRGWDGESSCVWLRVFFRPFRSLAGRYLSAPIPAVRQHLRPFQKVSEGHFHEGIGSGWHPTPLVSMPWLPLLLWEALLEAPAMELMDPSYQPGTSLWAAMTEQQQPQGPAFTTELRLTHPRPGPPLKEGTGFAS